MKRQTILLVPALLVALVPAPRAAAQTAATSAPLTDIRYQVTFTRANAARRTVATAMTFTVGGSAPVILSLPSWTPGAYEISNFARNVYGFAAEEAGNSLSWDKIDQDTWRIAPSGAGEVTVRFDYLADSLDNAHSWSRPDFLLFNGTNLFLYPEGQRIRFSGCSEREHGGGLEDRDGHDADGPAEVLRIQLSRPRRHALLRRTRSIWTARRYPEPGSVLPPIRQAALPVARASRFGRGSSS